MNRKAFIAPFIVIVVLLFLSVLTLIVDGGKMVIAHNELQGISEIAALSGGTAVDKGKAAVRANIDRFLQLNHISDCTYTIRIETGGLSITLTRTISVILSGRAGFKSYEVEATSKVVLESGQVRLVQ